MNPFPRQTLVLLLGALALPAQDPTPPQPTERLIHHQGQAPILIRHDPLVAVPDDALLSGLLAQEHIAPLLREVLGDNAVLDQSWVYARQPRNREPGPAQQPPGVHATELHLSLRVRLDVTPEKERTLLERCARLLEDRLNERMYVPQAQLLQEQLAESSDQLARHERQLLTLRHERLRLDDAGLAQAHVERAERARRLADLSIDLRTEEAMQQRRQELLAEARERLAKIRQRIQQVEVEKDLLITRRQDAEQRQREPATAARARADLEKIATESMASYYAENDAKAEHTRLEGLVHDLAGDLHGATLRLHELLVRREQTQALLDQVADRITAMEKAAVQALVVQQQIDAGEQEVAVLRSRRQTLLQQGAALRPVRVELWR